MPEEEKDTTGADDAGTGAGDGDDQNQGGEGEAGDQNTDEKKDGGDGDDAGEEGDKTPTEKKEESKEGEDDEPEIRTRKSPKDYIIERKQRKIERLQAKKAGGDDDEEEDDDEDVLPEDKKAIKKVVTETLTPIIQRQLDAENEQEIKNFLADNSEFKPYEKRVRKLMTHPSRAQVPIQSLFYETAGPDLMKLGAQKKKEADEEANQSNAGGGSSRGTGEGKKDWSAMPDEEFAKEKQRIMTAPRD